MKVTPLQFLTAVAFVMRSAAGTYKARKVHGNNSTADTAVQVLHTDQGGFTLDDTVMAEEAIGYVEQMQGDNDFSVNLKKFVGGAEIDLSNKFATGTAAYAIQALKVAMEREVKVAGNASNPSKHVGVEGDRKEFTGTHLSYAIKHNTDGSTYSVTRFKDVDGNVFQAYGLMEKTPGDAVACKGTVKKHLERDGLKFTTLSRAKWTDGTGIIAAEEKAARKKARMKAKSEKIEQAIAKALGADAKAYEVAKAADEPGQAEASEP